MPRPGGIRATWSSVSAIMMTTIARITGAANIGAMLMNTRHHTGEKIGSVAGAEKGVDLMTDTGTAIAGAGAEEMIGTRVAMTR